jgi:membrane fusion protein, multidrug efflux system
MASTIEPATNVTARAPTGVAALLATVLVMAAAGPAAAQQPGAGMPPPAVVVERIEVQPVNEPEEFIARVEAIDAVDIRARVQGFLRTVAFSAGQAVEEGDLLFEIERDQYEAAVASAQAQLSRAEASREEARRSFERNRVLVERQTVAQATLDEAQAAFDVSRADVEAAQAALRTAELDLSYTRITAPIAGRIGRALYTRGNLVGPSSGALARITQLDPIRVVFSLAEGRLVTLRQQQTTDNRIDPQALRLTLRLPNGTEYNHRGRIEYVESEVNPQTGTVAVRLIFPNPDRLLLPNQFVTLMVREEDAREQPVVPQTAVLQDRQGRFVYVLQDDDTVTQQRIETGARVQNGWAVTEGLNGGEIVVVQGIQRLTEGAIVRPSEGQPVGGQP